MRLYCSNFEDCGWTAHMDPPEELDDEDLVCPTCFSRALIYGDHERPAFLGSVIPDPVISRSSDDDLEMSDI